MTSRRNKMLTHLLKGASGEMEETLMKLSIERICADMCEYYSKFYKIEGPGAMVFQPQEDDKESMFYLPVEALINALDDNKGNEALEEVFQSAIRRAEALDPTKESLFLIQDSKELALVHYKHDTEGSGFMML